MDKLKMHSPDLSQQNLSKIRALFPNCVTETTSNDGSIKLAIDFDLLKQELSDSIVEGPQERYHLNWPGKREALMLANAPVAKTFRPSRQESVNFDSTKNLFIEGDNLEALKLLQETYLGAVKLIYIDPPYNTGNDFIYNDDFSEDYSKFLLKSNQNDHMGNRLTSNSDSSGRFHSDWLSMIYPRLKLARNLLTEDGLIFISIDDNELSNLKCICDEIFGKENCRGIVSRPTGTPSGQGYNILVNEVDYILVYSKSSNAELLGLPFTNDDEKIYDQVDAFGKYLTRSLRKTGGEDRREDRPTMYYGINSPSGDLVFPIGPGGYESRWRCGEDTYRELCSKNLIEWKQTNEGWKPYQKFYLEGRLKQPSNLWQGLEGNKKATLTVKQLFGLKAFDTPKPVGLIEHCLKIATNNNDLVLDFFAGSSTTAHAVMNINATTGRNLRFIMVQLPEDCAEKSEAAAAGYKTIADVSKDRIRKAGEFIQSNKDSTNLSIDTGFRVLKIDTSNLSDVYYTPSEFLQGNLNLFVDHIKKDRTEDDLLFQVLLDWGIDLGLSIKQSIVAGKNVFFVNGEALLACFASDITEDVLKELAKFNPLRIVFRDDGFKNDVVKINAEQIFRQLTPHTEIKTI